MSKLTTLLFIFAFLMFIPLVGQEENQEKHKPTVNHYHLSAFAGFTTNYKGKQGYKLGIEYEYRLSETVGLGGTFDFTGNDFNIFAFSVGTTFYPFKFPLIPALAVGLKNYDKSKWKPFYRVVLLYDFHIDDFSISPMVMYDLFSQKTDIMSLGLTLGYSLH